MKNGYEASINSAVRRRESILASTAAVTTDTPEIIDTVDAAGTSAGSQSSSTSALTSGTSSHATNPETVPQTSTAPDASTVSSSQRIAQAVLSGQPVEPILSPNMARLSAALSSGSGVQGHPIVVTLNERK